MFARDRMTSILNISNTAEVEYVADAISNFFFLNIFGVIMKINKW